MMEGTEPIDELMRPVLAAIRRHVKNPDAVTDIYNRAYEAVMKSMDANQCDTCHECDGSGEVAGDYFSDDGLRPCLSCGGSGRQ